MKQAANLIDLSQTNHTTQKSQDSYTKLADKPLNRLFALMSATYGYKWTSQIGDEIALNLAREQWAKHLAEFSLDQIAVALDAMVDNHPIFPPTIGEFKRLCTQDTNALGLPTALQAWSEIVAPLDFDKEKIYSHGIILAVIKDPRVDVYNFSRLSTSELNKSFNPIYAEYVKRVANGEKFELPKALANKKDKAVTPDEMKKAAKPHLEELSKILGRGKHDYS